MSQDPPVRPPRQDRSRKTLDRLVSATEELLSEKSFAEATIAEIVNRGQTSVGAFYGRFADKEALLQFLDQSMEDAAIAYWDRFLAPGRWKGASVTEIMQEFISNWVRAHREKRGVLRTLFLYARNRPQPEFLKRARRLNGHVLIRLTALLLRRRHEIGHPNPEQAIGLGLLMVVTTMRESILFDDKELYPMVFPDEVLASELTRSFLAYLGVTSGEKQ
jgi:AcrR family transcriptional regulator